MKKSDLKALIKEALEENTLDKLSEIVVSLRNTQKSIKGLMPGPSQHPVTGIDQDLMKKIKEAQTHINASVGILEDIQNKLD